MKRQYQDDLCEIHGLPEKHDLAGYGPVCSACFEIIITKDEVEA